VSALLPPGLACAKILHGIMAKDPAEPYLQRANAGLLTDGHLALQRVSDLAVCDPAPWRFGSWLARTAAVLGFGLAVIQPCADHVGAFG
jgi:hypothetical protein